MTNHVLLAMTLSAFASAGCISDDVLRDVQFEAVTVELPSGQAQGASDIDLSFTAVEALEDGRFILWGVDAQGDRVALAEVAEGDTHIPAEGLPMDIAEIAELIISEEEAGTTLPSTLDGAVLMRGDWPGALEFGDLHVEMFAEATGTASIHNKELTAAMERLPALPVGYGYGLSLTFGHADDGHADDGHDDGGHEESMLASEEGHETGEEGHTTEEGEDLFLGMLDEEGHMDMESHIMLGTGAELVLTIESLMGHEEASHLAVMRGLMLNPDAVDEEPDNGGGGHEH